MLNYINKTPLPDALCIVGYYSLGLQCLVQPNSTGKRIANTTGNETYRQAKQVQTLSYLHADKKLTDPELWPRVPFYGFDLDMLDMASYPDDYMPLRLEGSGQHANSFPYNVLKHQAWFMSRHVGEMRNRRRAIVQNKYDPCRPFFTDAYDRAQYFAEDRPQEWRDLAYTQYRDRLRAASNNKERKLVKLKYEKGFEMMRGERLEHMRMHRPINKDSLLILVDVVDLYTGSGNLNDFKPSAHNVLPTLHNALALYLSVCTDRHNKLMAELLPAAMNDALGNISFDMDIKSRLCSLLHLPIDLYRRKGPLASKRMQVTQSPARERFKDQVILPWRETHQEQTKLLGRAQPLLSEYIPHCHFHLPDHLLHAPQESKKQHAQRLARRAELREIDNDDDD